MSILWKPNGSLDIQSESTDLPEQGDGKGSISSGAMVRCKNLDVSRLGVLETRSGSSRLSVFNAVSPITYLFEAGGNRYEFGGVYSYYNEMVVSTGGTVETPTITPAAGNYASAQIVTMSCLTLGAIIYFTTDGSVPNEQSSTYSSQFIVPLNTTLIFYAVDPNGFLSDSEYVVVFYGDSSSKHLITELGVYLVTETSNNIMTEGG
jgi:hypothetical protein